MENKYELLDKLLATIKNAESDECAAYKAPEIGGHDERNWFTCAVPGGASSVSQAKQALKPVILQEIESKEGLKASRAHKRHRRLNSGRKIHRPRCR